jgi:4-hydroxybenzoate polyprenyltransferase
MIRIQMHPLAKAAHTFFAWRADIVLMYVVVSLIYLHKITGFNIRPSAALAILLGNILGVFGVYTLNVIADRKEDAINETPHHARFAASARVLCPLVFLASFTCYAYGAGGRLDIYAVWFSLAVLGIWYSVPRGARLKDWFLVKNVVPAFCWLLSVGAFIAASFPLLSVLEATGFSFSLFFLALTFEILWDMPDREGDRALGIRTIPALFGNDIAKLVVATLLLGAVLAGPSIAVQAASLILLAFTVFVKDGTTKYAYHVFLTLLIGGVGLLYLMDLYLW